MDRIIIRKGLKTDLKDAFARVKELAEYEKAAVEVATSVKTYELDFEAGWFELLVAETEAGENLGIMIYYNTFSTWKGRMLFLEDFVVAENARRKGVGEKLWAELVKIAKQKKCALVKWQVLDWNEPARKFYLKFGAELEPGWENGKLFL